jgi:hypothetical protein
MGQVTTSRRQARRRPSVAGARSSETSPGAASLEVCLAEYQSVREEIAGLLEDVNRNYQWVLATVALLAGSQVFGLQWVELRDAIVASPWILLGVAYALLWFPAYDITRWVDLRVADEYLRQRLVPRMRTLADPDGNLDDLMAPSWEEFRNVRLASRFPPVALVWTIKFAVPYLPTLLAATMYVVALRAGAGLTTPSWVGIGAWGVLIAALGIAFVRAGAMVPRRA